MISIGFLPLLFLFFVIAFLRPTFKRHKNLPPGPQPWPILGNLLQLGNKPHATLAHMARIYGPLISVRLGAKLLIVASSPSAAADVLKTQDRLLSARDVPHTYRIKDYISFSLPFAYECDDRWKALRTICKTELFTTRMLDFQTHLREKKVSEVIGFIFSKEGEAMEMGEMAFAAVFNIIGNVVFSRDVLQLGDDSKKSASGLKHDISRLLELGLAPNLADLYPVLGSMDIQGLNREATVFIKRLYDIWEEFIRERRAAGYDGGDAKGDFLDVLLCAGYEDLQIKATISDMFVAGTDTTTTLIEWTMSELARNPKVMRRIRDELQMVVGAENVVKESHLNHLIYLHACIKESLRLHPLVPLLLPRQALDTCDVMNYTIPKDCRVMVNVWAIGRDPGIWKDPLTFSPERFMETSVDYKGNHFEFTPFGAGRRICPGLLLATRVVQLILASFIHTFHWSLPHGMQPDDLNMDEKFGLTLERKHPLVLVPKSVV
ncbi:probable (S)-N-methylcoclaurine 3'-hydroxylase isozyme 2 [Magnolia sinica]|uniref:probable (S)-N-methylcoclaurine 3'-hydroxylase isozyme 2 n=1 Tax=Magnolia sinica TaxID=86752 RepID=UPI002658C71B|nr:probable (S)-N-methylcoclaurine 3'-hydroxylase isozyme 2 [Magnolia sinica]